MAEYQHVKHEFEPVFDKDSRILILGTLPSVKSRERNFYYGHPQNRFWKLLAHIFDENIPETIAEKKGFLLKNRIALWDVVSECDIAGSNDNSIRNVEPANINEILEKAHIEGIYANGGRAYELYMKYCYPATNREIVKLPSTSPANAVFTMEKLLDVWKVIR